MKKLFNKLFLICLISVLNWSAFSQSTEQSTEQKIEQLDIYPSPPNSANLGKYGQVPINQFSGNMNFNIPLIEVGSKKKKFTVDLLYSSDGVKVDQYESNVGMGWMLNAGGVITRQVRDYQDNYNGRLAKPESAINSEEMANFLNQASSAPQVDTQPDIYTYNFNGQTGKFFLDDSNNVIQIEPSGLKIEVTERFFDMGLSENVAPEIIITDTSGVKYYFGGLNAIESSSSRRAFTNRPIAISDEIKVSWYITKIEDPNTKNEILFNYDSRSLTYFTGNDQNLWYENMSIRKLSSLQNYQVKSYLTESILREIVFNNGKINFNYSSRYLNSPLPLSKLDELIYSDSHDNVIKKISFEYEQFEGNSFPNQYNQSFEYFKKRIYLTKIKEFSTSPNPKVHEFEYYSPEELPARFSFAQDSYGVFNGKNNSSLISDENIIPFTVVSSCFSDEKLANRRPDKNFGYYGLLKKINYPTKGSTEIMYEPHVKGKTNLPIYPDKDTFSLNVASDNDNFNPTNTSIFHSATEQTIKIKSNVVYNCEGDNPFELVASLKILDLSTNQYITFVDYTNPDYPMVIGEEYLFTGNSLDKNIIADLKNNTDYQISLHLFRPCQFANVYFDYYISPITFQEIDKEIGGFRISKLINKSEFNSPEEINYFYGPLSCLSCQSGEYTSGIKTNLIKHFTKDKPCEIPSHQEYYTVESKNLGRIYSSQGVQFGYEYVTKTSGNNFEIGAEQFKYEIIQDNVPVAIIGDVDSNCPTSNAIGSGKLLEHKIYKKNGQNNLVLQKETTNEYFHDVVKDKKVFGYSAYISYFSYARLTYPNPEGGMIVKCALTNNWDQYSLNRFETKSEWKYLKQSTERTYDSSGQNPIEIVKNYAYDNANHLQLTGETTTNSNNETIETKYFYAHEKGNQAMIDANMIGILLGTKVSKNTENLSEQETVYGQDTSTNNLLLPKSILVSKGIQNLKTKVTFNSYDDKGNITQYTPEGGIPVAVIWGYDKTQPIAKIENATYVDVQQYEANLQTLSNGTNEQGLIDALNTLRPSFPNAMVTTYTYKPLIGVSTITDPKGNQTTYEYDAFNRLKQVKDHQGKVLSENEYHYKN